MNELPVRAFFQALVHTADRLVHHERSAQPVQDAVQALRQAVQVLTTPRPEVVLTLSDGALYLGPKMLPHTSVEFNGVLTEMGRRGLDSITVVRDAHPDDLARSGRGRLRRIGRSSRSAERCGSTSVRWCGADLEQAPDAGPPQDLLGLARDAARSGGGRPSRDGRASSARSTGSSVRLPARSILLATVRNYDETTYYHSVNVCLLATTLGQRTRSRRRRPARTRSRGPAPRHRQGAARRGRSHQGGRAHQRGVGTGAAPSPGRALRRSWRPPGPVRRSQLRSPSNTTPAWTAMAIPISWVGLRIRSAASWPWSTPTTRSPAGDPIVRPAPPAKP